MSANIYTHFSSKLRLTAWLFLFFTSFANAHNGTLKGLVFDAETRTGLIGAHVKLLETGQATFTDELGIFSFHDLPSGKFTVSVSYIGFVNASLEADVKDHESTSVKIPLTATGINLPDVEIKAISTDKINNISALDIQARPVNTSQDILRIVPGLVIAQHAGGGKAEQIFLRGFDIDHGTDIRITVDGLPVNMVSHAHGQGYADLHWLIPEMVRGVDFAKGNYDASAGDFATAGHVNFNTPTALNQSMIKLEGGQFDTWRAVAAFDLLGDEARAKNQNAWLASEYYFSNGYFDSPQNFTRFNLMGRYTSLMGENQSLSVSFSTFRSKWDASGQIPQRAVASGSISRFGTIDDTEGGETSRSNVSLVFMKNPGNRSFFKNQVYLVKYDFELYSNFTFFLKDPVNGDQIRQKEDRTIIGYNGSWSKEITIGGKELNTEIGFQLRHDDVKNNELSRTANRRETLSRLAFGNVEEANAGIYLDETLKLSPRWTLNAGLRYDQFYFNYEDELAPQFQRQTASKGIVLPKINLFFDASRSVRLFAHAGVGFHSNDARVVVAQEGREVLPKAHGVEAGVLLKPIPRVLFNFSVWRLDLEQEFVYVGDEGVVEPSGRTKRQGLDLSARWQVARWLFADADFNYTLPRSKDDPEGQNYIPLAPTVTSIGGLTAQAKSGLFGSIRYRYIGDRPANEDNSVTAQGQFVTDVVAGWKKSKYEVNLSIQNVFDTKFNDAQFETESRLKNEPVPITELHFTPGTPFFLKGSLSYFF